MSKIVPIGGKFENPKALLARIMEDADEIQAFAIFISFEDAYRFAHINMTLEQAAVAAAVFRSEVDETLTGAK